ncbi:unnamed protein product, partial [Prorocentrum cordatum]
MLQWRCTYAAGDSVAVGFTPASVDGHHSISCGPLSADGHYSTSGGFEPSFGNNSGSTSSEVQSDNFSSSSEQHEFEQQCTFLGSDDDLYAAKASVMAKAGYYMVDLLEDLGDQTKGAEFDFECEPVDVREFVDGDRSGSEWIKQRRRFSPDLEEESSGTLPDPGLSSAVPVPDLDDVDDDFAALQLMVTSQDLPFGWEFDGTEAKLSDIFVDISTRNMTPHERAALTQGKRKELTEFFGNDVWEFHKPTGEEDPRRMLEAKWVLKWTKNDDGTQRAKARLVLQGFNDPDALGGAVPKDAAELTGVEPDTLMKLIKPMYGQVDAPRRWWLRAVDDLKASGLKQHPLDPCMFLSFDEDGNCDGFIPLDVDDMLGGGDRRPGSNHSRVLAEVKRKFKFRKWIEDDRADYCGSDVKMATYAKNLKPITIDQKSSDNTRELTIKEKRQLRANKTLRFYRQNSGVGLKMKKIGQVCDIVFVAMTDAAWQQQRAWAAREFAKRSRAAMIYDGVGITMDESTHMAGESALVVDAKALYDAAQTEGITSFQDKRASIEVLALRERTAATMTRWRRVSSVRQYADGLAKIAARQLPADRLRYGGLQLKSDPTYTVAKKKKKTMEERQESIDQTRLVTSAATRKATTPFMQLAMFAICCCRSAACSGYDAKGEDDGCGIVVWFAMFVLLIGLMRACPVASYLIKTKEAECKCKTELAVPRAKAEMERIEKERQPKGPPRDERGGSSGDAHMARSVGVQSMTTYKLSGDVWKLQHETPGFRRAGEVTTEPEATRTMAGHSWNVIKAIAITTLTPLTTIHWKGRRGDVKYLSALAGAFEERTRRPRALGDNLATNSDAAELGRFRNQIREESSDGFRARAAHKLRAHGAAAVMIQYSPAAHCKQGFSRLVRGDVDVVALLLRKLGFQPHVADAVAASRLMGMLVWHEIRPFTVVHAVGGLRRGLLLVNLRSAWAFDIGGERLLAAELLDGRGLPETPILGAGALVAGGLLHFRGDDIEVSDSLDLHVAHDYVAGYGEGSQKVVASPRGARSSRESPARARASGDEGKVIERNIFRRENESLSIGREQLVHQYAGQDDQVRAASLAVVIDRAQSVEPGLTHKNAEIRFRREATFSLQLRAASLKLHCWRIDPKVGDVGHDALLVGHLAICMWSGCQLRFNLTSVEMLQNASDASGPNAESMGVFEAMYDDSPNFQLQIKEAGSREKWTEIRDRREAERQRLEAQRLGRMSAPE